MRNKIKTNLYNLLCHEHEMNELNPSPFLFRYSDLVHHKDLYLEIFNADIFIFYPSDVYNTYKNKNEILHSASVK